MTDIVNGLLLRDGCVLMARRSERRRSYAGMWSFPGGHVEEDESFDVALRRELIEEIGICPVSRSLLTTLQVGSHEAKDLVNFHFYAIDAWEGVPAKLGEEHSELRWVSYADAANLPNLALDAYKRVFNALDAAFD